MYLYEVDTWSTAVLQLINQVSICYPYYLEISTVCDVHKTLYTHSGDRQGRPTPPQPPDSISDQSEELTAGDQILEVCTAFVYIMYVCTYVHAC